MSQLMSSGGVVPQWTLADRIRKAREANDYSQSDLATITGISRASISHYEGGKTRPSKASLKLIAMATGVDRYWLLTGEAPGPSTTGEQGISPIICKTRSAAA